MNAERAYEHHTALVRALRRPGSPERAWFDRYHENIGVNQETGEQQPVVAIGDLGWLMTQERPGWAANVQMIVGYQPDPPGTQSDEVVGVVDPDHFAKPEAADTAVPDMIAFPRSILTDLAVDTMAHAPTIYVTADMVTMLEHAASALDETDLMPWHPQHQSGFVVLARPLRLPYGDGTEQQVDAFAWTTWSQVRTVFGGAGHAGMVWQFGNRHTARGDRSITAAERTFPSRRSWADSPDLVLNINDQFVTGSPVGQVVQTAAEATGYADRLRRLIRGDDHAPVARTGQDGDPVGRFQPYLAALLLLLSQEITAVRPASVGDHAARRARRAGRPAGGKQASTVTVVDLAPRRRNEPEEPAEPGNKLTTRQLVGGYWRWQPYGPQRRLRRRIYVADYVRGPEDAPLVVKPRVRRL